MLYLSSKNIHPVLKLLSCTLQNNDVGFVLLILRREISMRLLEEQLLLAVMDKNELNRMISEYLPFIKKQLVGFQGSPLEYDDMLSVAMLAFAGAVTQYQPGRGSFLAFAGQNIKNRVIDEIRKQKKYRSKLISISQEEEDSKTPETILSIELYDKEQERNNLNMEIEQYSSELLNYGISFSDLVKLSPKHAKARVQCINIANGVISNQAMRIQFLQIHKLPQQELAATFQLSVKTIEKHRRYIVALIILLLGDYTYLQTFLPNRQEVIG